MRIIDAPLIAATPRYRSSGVGAVESRTTRRVANSMWWVLTTSLVII
jgi:hypothetical protein